MKFSPLAKAATDSSCSHISRPDKARERAHRLLRGQLQGVQKLSIENSHLSHSRKVSALSWLRPQLHSPTRKGCFIIGLPALREQEKPWGLLGSQLCRGAEPAPTVCGVAFLSL